MPQTRSLGIPSTTSRELPWWWLVALLYCLSGLTSLAYEVLWARMLSMQFGVSIFGVVLTVAAFMLGLGLGSLAGVRWARQNNKSWIIFAFLEITIALYALLLPNLLHFVSGWLEGVASHLTLVQWYLLQGIGGLCLLVVPAFAMGVGFTMVLKVVSQTPLSLGKLYGLNTLGAAVGAMLPLWSLPLLGWIVSIRVIAFIGLATGGAALILSRFIKVKKELLQPGASSDQQRPHLRFLVLYAGIGAGSIMLEIGWIRLYGMVMLRTEYVLGVILAVFLLGIALGSMLLPRAHKYWLSVLLPFAVGGGVLLSLWLLPSMSAWVEHYQFRSFSNAVWLQALVIGVFTLPVTLALGAWLPLLSSRFAGTGENGVWLYGANSLGGGVGAIVACLVCIPWLGSTAMVVLSGLFIAALGLILVEARWAWLTFTTMLLLAWPLRNMPPVHKLLPKAEANNQNLYLYEDAISLTHVVQQQDGQRVLLSDLQRMDASTDPNAVEIQMDQARLALLLHPAPHSVLFLGLGTGISMSGSLPFPDLQRSAVELSAGAIFSASRWFTPVNGNIMDQTQIYRDDAKHFLSTTRSNFDVIIGDLFHPDLAGMGSLLSVQQFQRARNHLHADGIFVQWLALNQFNTESLNVVLRSFRRVYPEAQLFMDGMHLALVGPKNHFLGAAAMLENLSRLSEQKRGQLTDGEAVWTWLGRYWGPIPAGDGVVQDEWIPYIEFNLPRARYDGSINLEALMRGLLQRHVNVETAMKILGISTEDKRKFGSAYVATELMARGWIASMQGDDEKANNLTWLAYQANHQDRWIASALADNMMQSLSQATRHGLSEREALQRTLNTYPKHVGALRALWHLEKSAGNSQEAEQYRLRLLSVSPLDGEASKNY